MYLDYSIATKNNYARSESAHSSTYYDRII